jgi:hypothetical protein
MSDLIQIMIYYSLFTFSKLFPAASLAYKTKHYSLKLSPTEQWMNSKYLLLRHTH